MDSASPEMLAKLTIYNMPPAPPNFDQVGRFYIAFGSTWTLLVFSGMIFCAFNHKNPLIKIRCIPLSFGAILMLHSYWILAQITYSVGRTMPVVLAYDIQYFFMGIYYPLGMALFHASNLRFLHVAKLQKQFTNPEPRVRDGCNGSKSSILCRIRNLAYTVRIMLFIGIGIIFQILLTVAMWFACKKYHPTFGLPGTEIKGATFPEQLVDLGRGWEWWPSLVWQLVWTWMVAPYLVWRSWGIRDTMGWRTQTIGCCLASLHAIPMFLIASYVPAFEKINAYYTPSQWIHLSIMVFEILTVFVPVYLVIRSWASVRRVNDLNSKWETASIQSSVGSSTLDWKSSSNSVSEKNKIDYFDEELGDRLLTMTALDYVLKDNPSPLQEFSAIHDFSGENIAFLTRVAKFKKSWPVLPEGGQRLDVYNEALSIYADFISTRDAEFPLNLSSRELKSLEAVFEKAARILIGDSRSNPATPFDIEAPMCGQLRNTSDADIGSLAKYHGDVPEEFGIDVFDDIQSHVKYLVLTNT
ncbi:hypothetical protein C2857_007463 [Epichloe festucae Fl1]|uniref:RGS domain-containing protein n=1 Tax=Epichloe festucae (strain Fl1) TaxID=877507 RepID=A0A7S9KQT8_EPIFF|nr:hypothetical protein C2857_007463 [Epichloe festucae Fl1]